MDLTYIRLLVDHLNGQGVIFDRGLSDQEVETIADRYGFRFPPDLRKLLQRALPVSERFPNWRKGPVAALRHALAAPAEGILADVTRHGFWLEAWGGRPSDAAAALTLVRRQLAAAPPLIPVYGHHYLPAAPAQSGNPVFAVVQTDITQSGCDLASFFAAEFAVPCPAWAALSPRPTAFWDELVA